MRITNSYIQRSALGQIQKNLQALAKAQQQVGSGKRLQQASDDPAAANQAMQTRSSLRALDQYQSNVDAAKTKASLEETVLDQITNLLGRAKELGVAQNGATANAQTRAAAGAEVEQLLAQAVSLGNTKYGDQYLFGGSTGDTAPFDDTGATTGTITGNPETQIGAGRTMSATHNGDEVFVQTGTLKSLSDLAAALKNNDADAIDAAMTGIDDAFNETQTLVGENGAKINQLDIASSNLDAFSANLQALQSSVEDVDVEEAITALVSRQMTYQAAMVATTRVMGLSLANYL